MADAIVFTQDELLAALNADAEDILLCDNNFHLPPKRNITYTAIGHVTAWADFSDAADFNITCIGFSPKTKKRPKTVHISNKAVGTASLRNSSSFSSFASSYSSYNSSYSFGLRGSGYMLGSYGGSYSSSYRLWSGYEMSFRYQTSYGSNYNTSYSSSYSTSYRLSSSYKSSFSQSFTISSFIHGFKRKIYTRVLKEISVNGYGIHLI